MTPSGSTASQTLTSTPIFPIYPSSTNICLSNTQILQNTSEFKTTTENSEQPSKLSMSRANSDAGDVNAVRSMQNDSITVGNGLVDKSVIVTEKVVDNNANSTDLRNSRSNTVNCSKSTPHAVSMSDNHSFTNNGVCSSYSTPSPLAMTNLANGIDPNLSNNRRLFLSEKNRLDLPLRKMLLVY